MLMVWLTFDKPTAASLLPHAEERSPDDGHPRGHQLSMSGASWSQLTRRMMPQTEFTMVNLLSNLVVNSKVPKTLMKDLA